jgi:hypothetical protein
MEFGPIQLAHLSFNIAFIALNGQEPASQLNHLFCDFASKIA